MDQHHLMTLVAVHMRRIEAGVKCQCDATINTDGRIEDAIQISERDRPLRHLVDDEVQRVALEIQKHADGAAGGDSSFHSTFVYGIMLEP